MFQVGDKVVCPFGAGEVVRIDPTKHFSVVVLVGKVKHEFTSDGRCSDVHAHPTLFHGTEWPVVAEPDRRVWRKATLQDIADAVMGERFEVRYAPPHGYSGVITNICLRPPISITFRENSCVCYLDNLEVLR